MCLFVLQIQINTTTDWRRRHDRSVTPAELADEEECSVQRRSDFEAVFARSCLMRDSIFWRPLPLRIIDVTRLTILRDCCSWRRAVGLGILIYDCVPTMLS